MASGHVTLEEVAQIAGVATSTVSRVLRGEVGCASSETAERIRQTALELGYHPNFAARLLASGKSHVIGVATGRPGWAVYTQQLAAISAELAGRGYQAVPLYYENPAPVFPSPGDALSSGMLEGLLVCAAPEQLRTDLERALGRGLPTVSLLETPLPDVPRVTVDYTVGTRMATRYLISLGHTRIAAVNCSLSMADNKDTGYRQAVEEEGLSPMWLPYSDPYDRPAFKVGYDLAQQLLQMEDRPTAAICSNDEVAVGVVRALRDHGLRVPQDLSVIGFDDIELARYCVPALTTVRQPIDTWAAHAVDLLLTVLDGDDSVPDLEVLSPELVVRESCNELPE